MPRDLFSTAPREETLVASPESATPKLEPSDGTEGTLAAAGQDGQNDFTIYRDERKLANAHPLHDGRAKETEADNLHPYVQTLSISNLEDCVALEKAVFPENERCSREKVGVPNRVLYNSRPCAGTSIFTNLVPISYSSGLAAFVACSFPHTSGREYLHQHSVT